MFSNIPKNTEKYHWTQHSLYKMRQYGLSPQRVLRVIRNPERKEEGIVKNTIAVMQPASTKVKNGKKTWSQEIWAMYQNKPKSQKSKVEGKIRNFPKKPVARGALLAKFEIQNSANCKIRIISAWRYPGVSPKNNPIPKEILEELSNIK